MHFTKRVGGLATFAIALAVAQASADTLTLRQGITDATFFPGGYTGVSDTTIYYYRPNVGTNVDPEVWMRSSNGGYGSLRTSQGGPLNDRNLIHYDLSALTGQGITVTSDATLTFTVQPASSSSGQAVGLGYSYKIYEIAAGNAGWVAGTGTTTHNGYGTAATTNTNAQDGTATWFYKAIDTDSPNTPYTKAVDDTTSVKWLSQQTSLGNIGSNPEGYANTGGLWNPIDIVDQDLTTTPANSSTAEMNKMDAISSAVVGDFGTTFSLTIPAAMIQKWIDTPSANAGLLTRYLSFGGYVDLWSSNASGTGNDVKRPTLAFDYVVAPPLAGDFNTDGQVNALDIDLLFAATQGAIPPAEAKFDVSGNGQVNSLPNTTDSDADYWVRTIKLTEYGDANLDGRVNFNDLLALARHYNATSASWADGDFDGTEGVGFNDLLALARNYGFGTALTTESDFWSDWALAQSLVPEPTSLTALGLGGLILRRRRS